MAESTVTTPALATGQAQEFEQFLASLLPHLLNRYAVQKAYCQQTPTPATTCAFEQAVSGVLRETERCLVEEVSNHLEPEELADCQSGRRQLTRGPGFPTRPDALGKPSHQEPFLLPFA